MVALTFKQSNNNRVEDQWPIRTLLRGPYIQGQIKTALILDEIDLVFADYTDSSILRTMLDEADLTTVVVLIAFVSAFDLGANKIASSFGASFR
ncbi:unnamed protein product [Hymenolepis diminuta]|uniref:RuvB-like helicase n=1 Tax=Hymenolepis diminuta TaxID=6216 RepID=A0A0R3SUA3_HYMDI|nr:unnamed protein product [Hymenolepis diminuta]